jgi:hypothetical protein
MADSDVWFVMLIVDSETFRGLYEGRVPMSYKAMSQMRYGWVRDEGQSHLAAAQAVLETLDEEERLLVREAKVGRMTELVGVQL